MPLWQCSVTVWVFVGQEGQTGRSKLRRWRRSHCDRTIYSGLPRKPSNKGEGEGGGRGEGEAREMLRSDGNGREGVRVAESKQGHVEWPCEQGPGGSTKPR